MALLESVPNVSEGRDPRIVDAIAAAFSSAGARVADIHMDADHNRSVVTLLGDERQLEQGLVAGITEARGLIDLRRHEGVHPRVGAVDVVPLVPLGADDDPRAITLAHAVARRTGEELGLPVLLYGAIGDGRRPAFFRRGGPDELSRRIAAQELQPAYGPRHLDARFGALLVGVRAPLVAFNVEVLGPVEVAREVARVVRESSGGLPGVQALGLELGHGAVQVSTNLLDVGATPLHVLVERIAAETEARGARVAAGELVGLLPARCVTDAAATAGISPLLDGDDLPTAAARREAARLLRLERLEGRMVLESHLTG